VGAIPIPTPTSGEPAANESPIIGRRGRLIGVPEPYVRLTMPSPEVEYLLAIRGIFSK